MYRCGSDLLLLTAQGLRSASSPSYSCSAADISDDIAEIASSLRSASDHRQPFRWPILEERVTEYHILESPNEELLIFLVATPNGDLGFKVLVPKG
jgi:hypothetical protein